MVQLSREQACRLLAHYHFRPTDVPGVFTRLSTVQYDPLNPVGRNPDLVLQARVPDYERFPCRRVPHRRTPGISEVLHIDYQAFTLPT